MPSFAFKNKPDCQDKFCKTYGKPFYAQVRGAKQIAKVVNKIDYDTYIEPFLGRGSVFNKTKPAEKMIINDKDCLTKKALVKYACPDKPDLCEKLKDAKYTCGKDWTEILEHKGKNVLIYLDPPYENHPNKNLYKFNDLPFKEFAKKARSLKANVANSYSDKPQYRKVLCKKPFRCHTIKKNIHSKWKTDLLAVKIIK